jgi:acetoin:2,6-dichlorophenolindophenol oxidoreductase subunit alpha
VARCRSGEGPTLIEARTYRYREHAEFGGMERNLRQYRTEDEVERWRSERDPIANFRRRLAEWGVTDEEAAAIEAEVSAEADAAVTFATDSPWPEPAEAFTDLYATAVPIRS